MTGRLSDETVAEWATDVTDESTAATSLAREVQTWRALVNGGPCEETGKRPYPETRCALCKGTRLWDCNQAGTVIDLVPCPKCKNDGKCPDCIDGRRWGLIARLEGIVNGRFPSRAHLLAIIADLRKAVEP